MPKVRRKRTEGIGPTPERRRHAKIYVVPGVTGKAHRIALPDYYDVLRSQNKITADEHAALEHFHGIYRRAYGSDCQISRYDKGIGGGQGTGQQYALVRVRELASHMGVQYGWLEGLVIDGLKLRPLERRMGVRNNTGIEHLKRAVETMTTFWGMPND